MDKSILTKLIMLLIAITIFSTLLNSCNSKDKYSVGNLLSGKIEGYGGDVTAKSEHYSRCYFPTGTLIIDTE